MHPTIAHVLVQQRYADLRREVDEERLVRLARRDGARSARLARFLRSAGRSRLTASRPTAERRPVMGEEAAC